MKLRRFVTTSALLVGALAAGSGVAVADPVQSRDGIGYRSHIEDHTVVTTIDAGAFAVESDGKSVAIKDQSGATVVSLPLAYRFDGLQFPFEEEISEDGRTLRLTPSVDRAQATPVAPEDQLESIALQDVASPEENSKAQANFIQQLGIATTVGTLTGTAIGAVVGFVLGCTAGLVLGCLPVAIPAATAGGIVGMIAVGGPTLLIAGIGLAQTLTAPPGTTVWANRPA